MAVSSVQRDRTHISVTVVDRWALEVWKYDTPSFREVA
jgi:hypothetical protein